MHTELIAISPVAFMLAKEGDIVFIKKSIPKKNEYREKIGAAQEALLVFKVQTKVGMIPHDVVAKEGKATFGRLARIINMQKSENLIIIETIASKSKQLALV